MRKRYSHVICECTQRTAHRPLHDQSSSPQSEAREVLTREAASGSPGMLGRQGAPCSLEMPPPSQAGMWEEPGRAVLLSRMGSVDTHNSAQLYDTPCHPRVAHGKLGGKPGALGSMHSCSGTCNPADSSPSPSPWAHTEHRRGAGTSCPCLQGQPFPTR